LILKSRRDASHWIESNARILFYCNRRESKSIASKTSAECSRVWTSAGSSIYRKVTIISSPKNLVPRFRVILGFIQGYARVTEKFLLCCALRGHFEDMMLGTCLEIAHDIAIFETRVMLSSRQYIYVNSCVIRRCDLVFTTFVAFLSMRLDMLGTCVYDRLTNNYKRNWSWDLDVMRRIESKPTREHYCNRTESKPIVSKASARCSRVWTLARSSIYRKITTR